jgi:hypothetical protein
VVHVNTLNTTKFVNGLVLPQGWSFKA